MRIIKSLFFVAATAVAPLSWSLSYDTLGLDALPQGLEWKRGNPGPVTGSPDAKSGNTVRQHILAYPLTLRTVGPDSNSSTRGIILENQWSLTGLNANDESIVPVLADSWAYDEDGKTIYYKLRPQVRWSDGEPVTADDYIYTLEFMRSDKIVAPWYNNYYSEQILDVKKYDDHTISVTSAVKKPPVDLQLAISISPTPQHFYVLDDNFVLNYNWKIAPNTGPYQITEKSIKRGKGKYIELERKKDWWGDEFAQWENRFNVNRVRYRVIKDNNVAFRFFERGEIDLFGLVLPDLWHQKAKGELYDNGYIHRLVAYTDTRQPARGLFLNQADPLLADRNVRLGLHHSMNFQKMISTVLRNDYERLPQHYTGYGEYSDNSIQPRTFDLDKADQYFTKAGFVERDGEGYRINDQGQRLSFTVTYGTSIHNDRLVVLKEEARKAGVELVLELLDPQASYKKAQEKRHQIAWSGWSTGWRPAYRQHYHSDNAEKPGTNNITNTADPELDRMIEAYRASEDEAEKIDLSKQIQRMLHERGALIPSYQVPYTRLGYWRWMQLPKDNYVTKTGGGLFDLFDPVAGGLFWIDRDLKKATEEAMDDEQPFDPVLIENTRWRAQVD